MARRWQSPVDSKEAVHVMSILQKVFLFVLLSNRFSQPFASGFCHLDFECRGGEPILSRRMLFVLQVQVPCSELRESHWQI